MRSSKEDGEGELMDGGRVPRVESNGRSVHARDQRMHAGSRT